MLGPDHPDVATAAGHLGQLYCDKGEFAKAEPLELRALAIDEKKLGEHVETVRSLDDLGDFYPRPASMPKPSRFISAHLRSAKKVLGSEHVRAAETLDDLA